MENEFKEEVLDGAVTREIAEEDFTRICRVARLKWNRKRDLNVQRDLDSEREFIIEEILDGRITVDEQGWPTVITQSEVLPKVKFKRRPFGGDLLAMDRYKANQDVSKSYAVMAKYLGVGKEKLEALESVDLDNVQVLHGIFLANRN